MTTRAESDPALLVSYHFYDKAKYVLDEYAYRDWVLDSGAFSAKNSGAEISLAEYIEFCRRVMGSENPPTEIFALDVIGDAESTKRNTERMWAEGIRAIPAYHRGEPERYLKHYAEAYPKIALGGVARIHAQKRQAWAAECFARVWPKKVHGFGFGNSDGVLGLPFHSTDATSWELKPCGFGLWRSYAGEGRAGVRLAVRGSSHDLRSEVEWYLRLERQARAKWRAQMEALCDTEELDSGSPTVRLAVIGTGRVRSDSAFRRKD